MRKTNNGVNIDYFVVKLLSALTILIVDTHALAAHPQRCEILFIDETARSELMNVMTELAQMQIQVARGDQNLPSYSAKRSDFTFRRHQFFALAKKTGLSRRLIHKLLADAVSADSKSPSRIEEDKKARIENEQRANEKPVSFPINQNNFVQIPAGEFYFDIQFPGRKPIHTTLTRPFEVMSSEVTQGMWVQALGQNPSATANHLVDASEVLVNGRVVTLQPLMPVTNMTWWSAVWFANKLSERDGLRPAYNFDEVNLKGDAVNGTLVATSGTLRYNSPDGSIYGTEGYRLPTVAEFEYMITDLGRSTSKYPHGLREEDLADYSWFEVSSQQSGISALHDVATTGKSIMFNNQPVHDLLGNAMEFMSDGTAGGGLTRENYTDRFSAAVGTHRQVRGGHFMSSLRALEVIHGETHPADMADVKIGFRLVRTVAPKQK